MKDITEADKTAAGRVRQEISYGTIKAFVYARLSCVVSIDLVEIPRARE